MFHCFSNKVSIFISLFTFFYFCSVNCRNGKSTIWQVLVFFLLTISRFGCLAEITWYVCISKSQSTFLCSPRVVVSIFQRWLHAHAHICTLYIYIYIYILYRPYISTFHPIFDKMFIFSFKTKILEFHYYSENIIYYIINTDIIRHYLLLQSTALKFRHNKQ